MKQRSIREYAGSPLGDYNIVSSGWIGKTGNNSPVSTKTKKCSYKLRSQKIIKSPSQKPIIETSPLGKWIQVTNFNQPQNERKTSNLRSKPVIRSGSIEEPMATNPSADDILKNISILKEEGKMLDDFDATFKENDTSVPSFLNLSLHSPQNKNPILNKFDTRSSNTKSRNKNKTKKSQSQKPIAKVMSPLEKWIQRKNCDQLHNKDKNGKISLDMRKKLFNKSDSFEKYGVILPTADDILENMNTMKEEGRILDDYDDLFEESDISIPNSLKGLLDSPEKIPTIELPTCEHLSLSELKKYFSKYLDYIRNISEGREFSQRHQIYKDHYSRSKLTYSLSSVVFTESQLEYLMKKIEKALDPEEKNTEYLFMVILPELCLKICMDEFDMSKEETIEYLNQRPID